MLGFQKNDHIFMQAGLGKNERLCSYDPQSQQLKNLGFYGWQSNACADYYVENLVLLDKPVLFDKQNGELSNWVASRKRKFWLKLNSTQNFIIYFTQFYLILGIYYILLCGYISKH